MEKQTLQLNDFNMLSLIGIGNYAKVVLVRKKSSGKLYAMKIMRKKKIDIDKDGIFLRSQALLEKEILLKCHHPFIINIHGTFQHNRKIYYVLQYCPGGELFGVLKRTTRLNEEAAKFYAAQIFLALEYLHSENFIYRDLKPENVLIDKQGYVRLVDFGLSCVKKTKTFQLTGVGRISGTPEYLPPEVFSQKESISTGIDWWSFGSLIFQMTVGFPPFYKQNQSIKEMKEKIITDNKFLTYVNSPVLRDLLEKLLNKNPQKRLGSLGSREIKNHPWFSDVNWQKIIKKEVVAPFVPEINSQDDTRWFDLQNDYSLTPPQNNSQVDKNVGEKYNSFSLSWKSSSRSGGSDKDKMFENASPIEEIEISIVENCEGIKKLQF